MIEIKEILAAESAMREALITLGKWEATNQWVTSEGQLMKLGEYVLDYIGNGDPMAIHCSNFGESCYLKAIELSLLEKDSEDSEQSDEPNHIEEVTP